MWASKPFGFGRTNQLCYVFCMWSAQVRNQLAIQVTNLQVDLDNVTGQLEEEAGAAENARSQLQRATNDLLQLKNKHDKEVAALSEQLDDMR